MAGRPRRNTARGTWRRGAAVGNDIRSHLCDVSTGWEDPHVSTPDSRDPYAPPPDSDEPPRERPASQPSLPLPRPQPPGERRPRPADKAPRDHPAARGGRIALLIGIAGAGMTILLFPVGLVLDVVAVFLGVRARRRGRKDGVRVPGALAAIILGASSATILLVVLTLLGPQLVSYSDCLSGANTEIAKQNCRTALIQQLEQRFGIRLTQSLSAGR
jgi:hypothetical protein